LAGDGLGAVAAFEGPAAAAPSDAEAHYWLASARLLAGDPVGAERAMDTGRVLQSFAVAREYGVDIARCRTDAAYASQAANRFYAQGLVAVSTVILGLALTGDQIAPGDLLQYGLALQHQGRCEEAGAVFRWAAETFPSAPVEQFTIYPQIFCEDGDARHAAAAQAWAKRYAPLAPGAPLNNPPRAGRKLHLGYVAPTFARSQLRQFIAPLLEHHDPAAFAVTLYTATASTEEGWPAWINIRPIGDLDDAGAAELIRGEGVDVLSDCWGHTAGSRISLFALRPAPVQVAWMNFIQTTGLDAMDYVLHGDAKGETDAEGLFTEAPWPIGPVFNAFRPADGRLPPTSTPALRTGRMTFGSFNHPAKLSGSILDTWGAILRGAPGSRLLLKYRYFADPVLQRVTQARFAARGVASERIVFQGHSTGVAYFEAFRDVDLMLDTWPAPGSTTTLDALSNGVPVLAKPTPTSGGRCVRAILQASGLGDLVAASPEDYVALALALAGDVQRLDALRARVRSGFESGACCDETGFTRRVESAFCAMFDRWRSRVDGDAHG
jgi:predicted O-linked N-acetylglucosamine transferase (SPINDLY family)